MIGGAQDSSVDGTCAACKVHALRCVCFGVS